MTHLHVHSNFTLLGGTASVDDLATRAAADGLKRLALTDTNALYGAVAFRKACQRFGIEPIIGMAVTVAPLEAAGFLDSAGPGLLVLLATGPDGYRSLCRLSSLIQSSPERQALAAQGLAWDALKAHADGLICLSGGRRGWIERCLRAGDRHAALRYAGALAGLFGERTYLALELHQPGDAAIAQEITALGQRLGVPTVAVQPVYCLTPQDRPKLRLLAAIDQNCRLPDVPASSLPDDNDPNVQVHWLSPGELAARFDAFPDALAAIADVANQCGPALPDGRPIWPVLKLAGDETPDSALAALAETGMAARYGPEPAPAVPKRLQHELDAIARFGYSPLFLVVADLVRYAREHEIPVSTRGSVANSLVAYCAGITTVDPIQHDLLFERFLSPARANPPDIDLDFCSRRRDRVLDYVRRTYGEEHVALVATISTLRPKSAVRETAKAYGLSDDDTERLIRLLPAGWHPDPRRRSNKTIEDVAAEMDDPKLRQVLLDAAQLVGQPDHMSVHPGGIVITPGPLTDTVPVQWTVKGFLITQYDHGDVEAIGLPKIDLLGIRALTVLADAAELVRRRIDPGFRLANIPLDDPQTGDLLQRAETIGVFQCDSTGAQRTLRQLKARKVQDLATANAFFKPGPALGGMARTFVRRYRGEEPVRYLHPALEPILGRTKGVLIFQEQILRIATEIAGLSWEQADALRRGMSHFGRHEMEATRDTFIAGCMRPAPAGHGFSALAGADTVGASAALCGLRLQPGSRHRLRRRQLSLGLHENALPGRVLHRAPGRLGRLSPSCGLHRRSPTAGYRGSPASREPQRPQVHTVHFHSPSYSALRTPHSALSPLHPLDGPRPGARSPPPVGARNHRTAPAASLRQLARSAAAGRPPSQRGDASDPVRRSGWTRRKPRRYASGAARHSSRRQRPAGKLRFRHGSGRARVCQPAIGLGNALAGLAGQRNPAGDAGCLA